MNARVLSRTFLSLLLVFLCSFSTSVLAADKTPQDVRVGCVDIDSFLTLSNGTASGYGADYLREISNYTGWTYEFVPGTWSECLEWLKSGTIDLLLPAEYSEERAKDYLYSSLECCIDYVALLTNATSTLYYEDFANYDGIIVGMIRDNYLNTCFEEFELAQGFSCQARYYDTGTALSAALYRREVDAIVTGNLDIAPNTKIVAKFDYMPAYFITSRDKSSLMNALDDALYRINLENPYFTAGLYDTYYAPFISQSKVFTRAESAFIAQSEPLRVVCDSDNYPFEWYDKTSGTYQGIDVDILNLIAKASGLELEFVHTSSLLRSWEMIGAGEADLIAGVYLDEVLKEAYGLSDSISYTDEVSDAVCRKGKNFTFDTVQTVALRSSFVGTAEYLKSHYPAWTIITFDDAQACLEAVSDGKADITFLGTYHLQTDNVLDDYPLLSVLPGVSISVPMMLGIATAGDSVLRSILNKSILTITQSEKQQIIANNTILKSSRTSFKDLVREHPFAVILSIVFTILVLGICAFLLYHARIQKRYAASLQSKNEELARSNQAISAFFSRLSHDLRTPMNAVLSFSQFGLESASADEEHEYFKKIQESGQYLLTLINDTLEISKIDTGKLELDPEPYDFSELLATLTTILQVASDEKKITLTLGGLEGLTARFDKTHLQQILVNLLNNAIKFTPEGGSVSLDISCADPEATPAMVRFAVRDTGIGMSEEFIREKLYQPFEQERANDGNREIGTGLGLAIVKNLVTLMAGEITCESRQGTGTVFTVSLPTTFVAPVPEVATVAEDFSLLSGLHVLLCEDHPVNREIIVRILEKKGMIVVTASDGREGLERYSASKEREFAAILMDLRMPVMDGLEASRAIRALPRSDSQEVPIIAITANVFASDMEQCTAAGMTSFLPKPISPETLYATLAHEIAK